MKWIAFLVFILALNISLPGFSQSLDVERSSVIQEINGKSFYLHEVKKGETLSSIARAYEVKVSDIIGSNYGISENIQPGDIIKIQVKNNEHTGEAENKMNYRRVAKGETLYSLSQEYNVSIEEIKEANNGLPDGIKTDEFIKIPIKTASIQPSVAQKQQEKQNKDYFEYQAKEKISIYELAIKYRVSVDHILNLNPGLSEELISEEIIRIPIMASQTDFITHTVKSRQTMNRLARLYDIDIETIKAINPYISRHLSEGQVLRIPLPEQKPEDEIINKFVNDQDSLLTVETREKTIKEVCHDKYDMAEYDMALILPFFISEYDSIYRLYKNAKDQKPDPEFFKSFVFIQFYEGFLLAVDSMKNCGLNVKIHVFNLGDNIDQAKLLIKNPELKNMNLIVGPVYNSTFKILAEFAKNHRINIVNPFSSREEITWGNPYVFQPQPVISDQNNKLIEFLNEKHDYSQIFIARHNPYRDEEAFNHLKDKLNQNLESRKGYATSLYHEIIYSQDSTYSFEHLASVDHPNVVVVYADNKVFILDIMRSLNELRDTFNIIVIGVPEWNKIEGVEAEHLNNLNTHIISSTSTNYELEPVVKFVRKFRNLYATEPKEFAFSGYNTGIYFLSALMKFGADFNDCIQFFDMELLNMGYDFESNGLDGYKNKNWKILGMEDYKYKDISPRLKTYNLSKPPAKYYKYPDE